jgi:hypothetical protein
MILYQFQGENITKSGTLSKIYDTIYLKNMTVYKIKLTKY